MLEVEVKAKIKNPEKFEKKLTEINAKILKREIQEDVYFNHPCRDFAKTDEALRIRKIGNETFLTYKGKRLDAETKTREEIEIKCGEEISEILTRLGFKVGANVKKSRIEYLFENLHICVDDVEQLGNFVEIEGKELKDKSKIFEILKIFEIEKSETLTKSYLELLTEKITDKVL
ncbi:MAG: class IV adenylate cyclase [Candidatus Altarchaeum sp.]|nr:class IV adenylate cyclase [Candidatus Altarchaeum sp.]